MKQAKRRFLLKKEREREKFLRERGKKRGREEEREIERMREKERNKRAIITNS